MGKFDGILICTDLDGTLLKKDKTISEENIKAIEYFKKEGGYFTFVTGRMPFYVSYIVDAIKPNAPFGCINGGGLFDIEKNDYVWTKQLDNKALELAEYIDESFFDIGIQVNTFYKTYFCRENSIMESFRRVTGAENLTCKCSEITEPMSKILLGINNEEDMIRLDKMLKNHPDANKFDFVRAEETLYDILPKGIGKGTSIKMLCEILKLDKNNTIAIGDYDNDISMLSEAKIGVAVSNACENLLKIADHITVSNEENAIARVIYDLDEGKLCLQRSN